jgi:hypothetical protein
MLRPSSWRQRWHPHGGHDALILELGFEAMVAVSLRRWRRHFKVKALALEVVALSGLGLWSWRQRRRP